MALPKKMLHQFSSLFLSISEPTSSTDGLLLYITRHKYCKWPHRGSFSRTLCAISGGLHQRSVFLDDLKLTLVICGVSQKFELHVLPFSSVMYMKKSSCHWILLNRQLQRSFFKTYPLRTKTELNWSSSSRPGEPLLAQNFCFFKNIAAPYQYKTIRYEKIQSVLCWICAIRRKLRLLPLIKNKKLS